MTSFLVVLVIAAFLITYGIRVAVTQTIKLTMNPDPVALAPRPAKVAGALLVTLGIALLVFDLWELFRALAHRAA